MLLEVLVEDIFRRLVAADLARCACVSREWREYARKFAKPVVFISVSMEKKCLRLRDVEENKQHGLQLPNWLPEWVKCNMWSSEGFLIILLDLEHLVICEPLKNRWSKALQVPGMLGKVASVTIWMGSSPRLVVTGRSWQVGIYSFEKEMWSLRDAGRRNLLSRDRVSFARSAVRMGNALVTYVFGHFRFSVLRLDPNEDDFYWKTVHAATMYGTEMADAFRFAFGGERVACIPRFNRTFSMSSGKYPATVSEFLGQGWTGHFGVVPGFSLFDNCIYSVKEKSWKEVRTTGILYATGSSSTSSFSSRYLSPDAEPGGHCKKRKLARSSDQVEASPSKRAGISYPVTTAEDVGTNAKQ